MIQRSFVSWKEFGGWINNDGTVSWQKSQTVGFDFNESSKPTKGSISFHTHPGNGPEQSLGHSDRNEYNIKMQTHFKTGDLAWDVLHGTNSIVFVRTAVWYHDLLDIELSNVSQNIFSIKYFNPYPFNTFLSY